MDLSSVRGLLTPSALFLLLNLVIGTIAVISSRHRRRGGGGPPDPLARSSSSNVLERVRSLGLFRFRSGDLPPIVDFNSDQDPTDTVELHQQQPVLYRRVQSESDSKAKAKESGGVKIKKSASAMTWRSDEDDDDEEVLKRSTKATVRRSPETVDEEVDAKADDFINRFRQQLKLQRLDSLLRCKEML